MMGYPSRDIAIQSGRQGARQVTTINRRRMSPDDICSSAAPVRRWLPRSAAATDAAGLDLPAALPEGMRDEAIMEALPGKKPLIKLSYRPPNYETPIEYFRTAITPNDAFFVRYHLSDIPEVDAKTWKLSIGGDGANGTDRDHPRRSQEDAGRRRSSPSTNARATGAGLFEPHVAGRRMGLRRDGLRPLEGRAAQGRARQGRAEEGGDRDRASTAPTARRSTRRRTSSRASRSGRRSRTRP